MQAVELPPQRRFLEGRFLGALLGRMFRPLSGRRTGTAITGKSGLQEWAGADPQKFREIGSRRMWFKALEIPELTWTRPGDSEDGPDPCQRVR